MQRILLTCCMMLSLLFGSLSAQTPQGGAGGYVEGVLHVQLQPELAEHVQSAVLPSGVSRSGGAVVRTGIAPLDLVSQKVKATSMTRVFPYAGKFEERHKKFGLDRWYEIRFSGDANMTLQARNLYKAVPGVQKVSRVPVMKPVGGERFKALSQTDQLRAPKAKTTMPFNDPLLPSQWHYNNDGSIPGTVAGADINAFQAWGTKVTGSKDVLVAIVDGGFQVDHPDLKDNVWVNQAELNGKAGVDDDNNGKVDDVYGFNFVINSADINAHEHGTHVAGTVGATNNNGVGVAGVAGGSDGKGGVKMMVCQVFDNRSNLNANFAGALVYAADMGANIAQCSWGSNIADEEDGAISEGIRYFNANGGGEKMKGGLCIFAAGNTSDEGNYYPGCMDDVVAVGSITATKEPAYYSTRGNWVDVSAPGGLLDNGQQYGVLSTLPNSTYGYNEGTSMACPHVSGIAALILSKYGNKNFSSETLRTLLTTSVNDLYGYGNNAEYAGKFGSGYIDAYKALQGKEGAASNPVADFTITPSHDNALIEWIIPDNEEKSVDHHVIYYSTEAFTAESDLSKIPSVSVDTKFQMSGDTVSYELEGLKPTTKYYIAIVAYNRWGTASALSPVKEATTNAGPTLKVDKTKLTLTLDASKGNVAKDSLTVSNTGKGILKYSLTAATKTAYPSTSSIANSPKPGKVVPFSGTIETSSVTESKVVTTDYQAAEWPKKIDWVNSISAYLGETDQSKPNALAQYFYVSADSFPEGFNLTALRFGGSSSNTYTPVIEIYEGSKAISAATLLSKVEYSYFMYNSDINLKEQLFFKPGSSFWVVAKYPAGQKNPLGAGQSDKDNVKQYSFYSSDGGQTWMQLSEALKGGAYESTADKMAFDVEAISKNPDWSSVLSPTPEKGEVRPGESQTVTMKNDGQQLVNGNYTFNLRLNTNEASKKATDVTVTMKVSGYKAKPSSKKLIDYGKLIVGQSKKLTVEIDNQGFGVFGGKWGPFQASDVKCSSDQFEVASYTPAIAARSKGSVDVTFKPTKAGSFSGDVTMTAKDGTVHTFTVSGVAAAPAKLGIDTTQLNMGDLKVGGEEKTDTFTISNTGETPLQYVFPKFSNTTIEGAARSHKFGYTYISNLGGSDAFAYDNNPELNGETDITNQFGDNSWQSSAISLGFKFPFYGTDYDKVYVSSHGAVMFNTTDGNISCMVPAATCVSGLGYISAYANSGHLDIGANSKITYGRRDGKFVVKFKDVLTPATDGGDAKTAVSFHLALSPDGSVELYYDDYDPAKVFGNGQYLLAGLSDIECKDVFVVTDVDAVQDENSTLYNEFKTGTAVKIVAPARSMIKSLSSAEGYIGIGESKQIVVTAQAGNNLYAGELVNNLTLLTNDPEKPSNTIVVKANITGDLTPSAALDSTKVDFGRVFKTSIQKRTTLLSNNGKSALNVSSVTVKGGKFTIADELKKAFTVAPGTGKDIEITLPTETEGSVADTLVIAFADGTSKKVSLKGVVAGTPVWSINTAALEATTPYGENVTKQFTVSNTGDETMTFSLVPEDWYNVTNQVDDKTAETSYVFRAKTDGYDVPFEWADITTGYDMHAAMGDYFNITDYKEVTLPFSFPFYGKTYDKMYVYNTGFVSFDKPETDYKQFPEPPAALPTTDTFYKNIIAPFWGNHTMGTPSTDGVYYKAEGDHVVVSFINYGNSAMMGMDFQVLIYKNGTFKFQYKLQNTGMMLGVYGLCGIQDHDGKRGVNPSDSYIASGNAVMFYPVRNYTVAPAKSATVDVELLADSLAGEYKRNITLATNVPQKETILLPVNLTITGEAQPVFPDSVGGEAVAGAQAQVDYDFEVANKGTKAFKITNVVFNPVEDPDDPWAISNPQLLVYATIDDPFTGGISTTWTPYTEGMTFEVGKEPVKFRISYMDEAAQKNIDLPITFTLEGLGETTKVVPFKLAMTPAPAMSFDKDEIVVNNAAGDYTGQQSMTISNAGEYKLTYSLALSPSGRDEQLPQDGGGVDPGPLSTFATASADSIKQFIKAQNMIQPMSVMAKDKATKADSAYIYDLPEGGGFTNSIYYPMMKPWSAAKATIIGAGSDLTKNFYCATRYIGPAEGFNLTHLYFVGTIGDLQNVDIEASVIAGSDVAKGKVIGHGKLRVEKEEPRNGGYYGEPRMLEFDKPIYINPTDTFYVMMKYPAGYNGSALLGSKDGTKSAKRYMANIESLGGWVDIEEQMDASYGYGAMGYFMTCIEHTPGKPWIKLAEGTKTEGEIAPGESKTVTFDINAESAYFDKENRATLVIRSNDPMQKLVNYHVTLNKNGAPVVSVPSGTATVAEGDTIALPLTIADEEGEAFTVSLSDESGIASVASFTNGEGNAEGVSADENGVISVIAGQSLKLNVKLAPNYEQAGQQKFTVSVTDASKNTASTTIVYNVDNTNRAPRFKGEDKVAVLPGSQTAFFNYEDLFEDLDGDEMTYAVKSVSADIAEALSGSTGFAIIGHKVGEAQIVVTATDANGAATEATITVIVTTETGIDEVITDENGASFGNVDANGNLSATVTKKVGKASLSVFDAAGKLLKRTAAENLKVGQSLSVNLGSLPEGVYTVTVDLDGQTSSRKVLNK